MGSGDDIRRARKQLGWSQAKLAEALRLGKGGSRIVRGWEKGEHVPSGPTLVAVSYILRDFMRFRRPFV